MMLSPQAIQALETPRDFLFSSDQLTPILNSYAPSNQTSLIDALQPNLIPVVSSAEELAEFIKNHPDYLIAPYLLYKETAEDLLLSTSSLHMNWLWPNVLYVPTNVKGGDYSELSQIYKTAFHFPNIILFNHTIPHKSNPVMQELFETGSGDYLARKGDTFVISEGNGQAFIQMAKELAGGEIDFSAAIVIIVGVGGSGTLAAKDIIKEQPKRLILVDLADKSSLAQELGAEFYLGLDKLPDLSGERLVIIDSTAHFEDGIQRCVALDLVEKYDAYGNVFIDYNMNTPIGAYQYLKSSAGVGQEYVAITNYIMVLEIIKAAASIGVTLPPVSRAAFDQAVTKSLELRNRIKQLIAN